MKRIILFSIFMIFLVLTACSTGEDMVGETTGDAPESEEVEAAEGQKEKAEVPVEEQSTEAAPDEAQEEKSEENVSAAVEITDQTGGAWVDSIDSLWVHSAAVLENTGNVPVVIGEVQMNFMNGEGSVLGTDAMNSATPEVLKPGETAFVSQTTTLDAVTDPEEFDHTTYNFEYREAFGEDANLMEVKSVQHGHGDEYTPYRVTGIVENTTGDVQEDIRIAAGLYAEDGSLLGVLTDSISVSVNAGSEAGFELTYPEIPAENAGKVKDVEVKAYGWDWGF
ncbi:hypothetical protein SAMN04488081_1606 [Salimicrobium album]|uniref:Lipoprotein n=2 Tax=Salimicrobium album TaxID=50717 RepID=A0A1H3FDZ5_9BACI|nr:hypothetical protein SAMN04488081_1606 [Salimicrobium album]